MQVRHVARWMKRQDLPLAAFGDLRPKRKAVHDHAAMCWTVTLANEGRTCSEARPSALQQLQFLQVHGSQRQPPFAVAQAQS